MTANEIQKYQKRSVPWLRKKASENFRRWVRKRDEGKPCISCGSYNVTDAGHYYSAGNHPGLEVNEDNCHGQCRKCNMFLSGNLIEYRKGLLDRIGIERVEDLDHTAGYFKLNGYKHDRFFLIETILKYSQKVRTV